MKLIPKALLFFLCLALFTKTSSAQLSVSYYNSSLSKIGVAYNFTDRFWSELRLYSNTVLNDITPELIVNFNLVQKERHQIYLGAGGNVNVFTGLVFPAGVQFIPLENFRKFSLHIELQPSIDFNNDMILQSAWGIRYNFRE